MISNLNLDIEILHIEIDLNMLFLIFIEYESKKLHRFWGRLGNTEKMELIFYKDDAKT